MGIYLWAELRVVHYKILDGLLDAAEDVVTPVTGVDLHHTMLLPQLADARPQTGRGGLAHDTVRNIFHLRTAKRKGQS